MASVTPAAGSTGLVIAGKVTATFSEAMAPATINSTTFELLDGATPVPATVTYDPLTAKATLTPTAGLIYAKTYTARIRGGAAGVKDMSGRSLAADYIWTFSTETAPPPIALVASTTNPFSATQARSSGRRASASQPSTRPSSRRRCSASTTRSCSATSP